MTFSKKLLLGLFIGILLSGQPPVNAAAPDFNADRRVNIKCPSSIDKDRVGQFELDSSKPCGGSTTNLTKTWHSLPKQAMAVIPSAAILIRALFS